MENRHQPERWVSKQELAEHLGFSRRWIELRIQEGLPHARFGSRTRFKISEAEAWLQGGPVKPGNRTQADRDARELIGQR